jgi:hypothetical protein
MPKTYQYDPKEQFKYRFELPYIHSEDFSRWIFYEAYTVMSWNPKSIHLTASNTIHSPGYWRISVTRLTEKILIESNMRLFSLSKGLKFNCEKQTLLIG